MTMEVQVTIDNGGQTEVKVIGCPGPSCSSLTAAIEKALGSTVADTKTPEFYKQVQQTQQAKAGA
jgi:hypothetical protein